MSTGVVADAVALMLEANGELGKPEDVKVAVQYLGRRLHARRRVGWCGWQF